MMLIMGIVFALTIILGVPVVFCLGLAGLAFIQISKNLTFNVLPTIIFGGLDSFPLMAIPFFIMAGDLMGRCGILPKLVDLADSLVGHLRGGLAYITIVASMLFAGVTGVAVADAAAVGSMLIPSMISQGYSRKFSASLTASAAMMGPMFPPSVGMLIYAYVYGGGISVAKLFLMGCTPGVLVGLGMMAIVYARSFRQDFPQSSSNFSLGHVLRSLQRSLSGVMVPIILIGGIVGGVFTPAEAGAVAVAYALIIGVFVTRCLGIRDIAASFLCSFKTSAVIFIVLATAKVVSWILIIERVPYTVGSFFHAHISSPHIFLLCTILLMMLLGIALEPVATMILLIPVFGPLAVAYGIDPHLFGLIMVMTVQIALITPP
ncbi:MAG: TRAP transporter large permease, partial [Desulfobaccales bacterium]